MLALAHFSLQRINGLAASLKLQFEQLKGFLVLFRSARDLARIQGELDALVDPGLAHDVVDPALARALEPGLGVESQHRPGARPMLP